MQFTTTAKRLIKSTIPLYRRRLCPACGYRGRQFLPFNGRPDAQCPTCLMLERHRLLWCFLEQRTDLLDGRPKRLLHFAPERQFRRAIAKAPWVEHVTADLERKDVSINADITQMPFENGSFDAIICSHVLEHVPDDRAGLRECLRVLKPDGWAAFMVPIRGTPTYENPAITDPDERTRHFGQWNHVRWYGPDFLDRLRECGFHATAIRPSDLELDARYAIPDGEGPVYQCFRPSFPKS